MARAGVVPEHVALEVALLEAPHGAHGALERLLARVREQVIVQVLAGVDPVGHEAAEGAAQLGPRRSLGIEQVALRGHQQPRIPSASPASPSSYSFYSSSPASPCCSHHSAAVLKQKGQLLVSAEEAGARSSHLGADTLA